ncbi:UNKNOWN [Stylonychia lemnae]|uniref:Uncharacterized protein n=1 Tax=Stylonychia lemnae TaxID=5949 RepID=A0A078A8R6_STYLE|nr:UNKNOWN [Stylonychia lemnae]|eukprot:CDW78619.1 UNKNOWN [Stylonychia lemnae]
MSQRHLQNHYQDQYYERVPYESSDRLSQKSNRNRNYQSSNHYQSKNYQDYRYPKASQYQQRDKRQTQSYYYDQENDSQKELSKNQKIQQQNEKEQYEPRNPKQHSSQFYPNTQKLYQKQYQMHQADIIQSSEPITSQHFQVMPNTQQIINSVPQQPQQYQNQHILAGPYFINPPQQQYQPQFLQTPSMIFPNPTQLNQIYQQRMQFETPQSSGSSNDTPQNYSNNPYPQNSQFSTPKIDPTVTCTHPMTVNCLRKCAQWNLAIKFNQNKAIKIKHGAIAVRQYGYLNKGAQQFTQDIIDAYIQNETANQTSNVPIVQSQNLNLQEFNGFMPCSSAEQQDISPLELPLNNSDGFLDVRCEDILQNQMCENMFCVEFDLKDIPLIDTSIPLNLNDTEVQEAHPRIINQQLVDSTFHYYVNGYCHGQKILQHDLHYLLQGKKIVKSIQQRIIDYKEHIQKQVHQKLNQLYRCTPRCKYNGQRCYYHQEQQPLTFNFRYNMNIMNQMNQQGVGPFLLRTNNLHCKMLNIPKSVGVQFSFDNLPYIEQFLSNFNQLVLQNGIINKIIICFDLPLSKFSQKAPITTAASSFNPISPLNQMILKDFTNLVGVRSNNKVDIYSFKEEARPLNLLEEFQRIKVKPIDEESIESKADNSIYEMNSTNLTVQQNLGKTMSSQIQNKIVENSNQNSINEFYPQKPQYSQFQTQTFNYDPNVIMRSNFQLQQQMILLNQQQQQLFYQFPMLLNPNYFINQQLHYQPDIQPFQIQQQQIPQPTLVQQPTIQYKNNLELLLNTLTPQISSENFTLGQLLLSFNDSSINGAKVQLYNQIEEQKELLVMIPTLSSLYLSYFEQKSSQNEISDFLINLNSTNKVSQNHSSLNQNSNRFRRVYEYHEERPNYSRDPFILQVGEILEEHPNLKNLRIESDIDLISSWFAVVWTPIKHISINREDSNMSQSQLTQQFLVIYSLTTPPNQPHKLKVLGFIPLKDDNKDYWVQPIFSDADQSDSKLTDAQQAANLTKEYNSNKDRLNALKEKGIEFFESEGYKTFDYNFFVNNICLYYDTQ